MLLGICVLYILLRLILIHVIESSHTNRMEAHARTNENFQYTHSVADDTRTNGHTMYGSRRSAYAWSTLPYRMYMLHLKSAPDAHYSSLSGDDRQRPQHVKLPSCIAQAQPDTIHSNLLPIACRNRWTETAHTRAERIACGKESPPRTQHTRASCARAHTHSIALSLSFLFWGGDATKIAGNAIVLI